MASKCNPVDPKLIASFLEEMELRVIPAAVSVIRGREQLANEARVKGKLI